MRITFVFHDRSPWFSGQTLYFIEVMKQLSQYSDLEIDYYVEGYLHPYASQLLSDSFQKNDSNISDVAVYTKFIPKKVIDSKKDVLIVDARPRRINTQPFDLILTHSPKLQTLIKNAIFLPRAGYKVDSAKDKCVSMLTKHINDLSQFHLHQLESLLKKVSNVFAYGDRVSKYCLNKQMPQQFSFHISDILQCKAFLHTNVKSQTIPFSVATCVLSDVVVFSLSPYVRSLLKQRFSVSYIKRILQDDNELMNCLTQQKETLSDKICTFDEYAKKLKEVVG